MRLFPEAAGPPSVRQIQCDAIFALHGTTEQLAYASMPLKLLVYLSGVYECQGKEI